MNIERIAPEEAHRRLSEEPDTTYVDVRTIEEFRSGHVPGAVNIPLHVRGRRGLEPNPNFLRLVEERFQPADKLIVGCQRGGRSMRAVAQLLSRGYQNVVDMRGGFDGEIDREGSVTYPGWCRRGLPTQSGP